MASGEHFCKDCSLYFDTSQSLEVHLQYHNENLINMWMTNEDKKDCINASISPSSHSTSSELVHDSSSDTLTLQSINNSPNIGCTSVGGNSGLCNPKLDQHNLIKAESDMTSDSQTLVASNMNYYKTDVSVKSEPSNAEINPESPPFIGPSPISPMEYDYKMSPGLHSPQTNMITQGPPSGPGLSAASFPQQSPGGYYQDYSQTLMQQPQNSFGNFSSNYMNGTFEDPYYARNTGTMPRFHPYPGHSPVPTPSPGTSVELKEERLTPNNTPEILDLDSQKVLNSVSSSQSSPMGSLPPMWRPHEQFPSQNSSGSMGTTPAGLGPSSTGLVLSPSVMGPSHAILGPPSSGLGLSPTGLGPSPTGLGPSPPGLGPVTAGLGSSGIDPSSVRLGQSPSTGLRTSSSLGLSSGLSPSGLGPSMGMLPPLGQPSYGGQHPLRTHPVAQNVSNSSMSSYYPQGLSASGGLGSNPPTQYGNAPVSSPSPREVAPSEYPSNVKRAKSFKCEDCNKWFTSHGHLKRHYNTTLHKNMTKLNSNSTQQTSSTQPISQDITTTRPPILSPSAKSIGEVSTTSSHEDETNMSAADNSELTSSSFHPTGSAFQPLPVSAPSYTTHSSYPVHSPTTLVPVNSNIPNLPHYSQAHSFLSEQPLTAPAMYHGHFSTNSAYPTQPPATVSGSPFFHSGNNYIYPQQGGLHGPGLHSMNEFPGPNPVESFNTFRLNNGDRSVHPHILSIDSASGTSPDPTGDTGSEASMDSSESSTGASENYKCNDCSKTFNRMCYLTQHRSTYHEGEKPFKCGTCGKRFPDEITFTDHQGKHAGEKPYKCEVCPKQFNHKTDLRRHMCLHTGEKPFSCEQCGKGFIRKDHMLKHFQTHRKKALAAAANAASHPSMPSNTHGFPPPGLGPQHPSIQHPPPHGRPQHVVAPPVY